MRRDVFLDSVGMALLLFFKPNCGARASERVDKGRQSRARGRDTRRDAGGARTPDAARRTALSATGHYSYRVQREGLSLVSLQAPSGAAGAATATQAN
jgi:hypothetical protein